MQVVDNLAKSKAEQDAIEVPDYMKENKDGTEGDKDAKKPAKRRDATDIQFGRPQFGNRRQAKGILGGDDFESLDTYDTDGKQNQKNKKNVKEPDTGPAKKKDEEEKVIEKPKGPPKFFNANKGKNVANKNTPITGENRMYDFGVKYKSDNPEGVKKVQDKKEEGGMTEVRKDKRRIREEKTRFEDKPQGLDEGADDEGFEIVRNPT